MSLLVPKNRKPKFRVYLSIQDLTNVPLVSGIVHVRWHLQDSIRSETRGKTERSPITDHKVQWGYEISWTARMVIDKSGNLQNETLEFEVYQEMYGGKERHALGKLELNLAEYARSDEPITRRYLLQDSKVNSTLKLSIQMQQFQGDSDFHVPELKKGEVFGGIAGLISEGKEIKKRDDDMGFRANHDEAADRVAAQLQQDIYRNSVVRKWQAQAGELDPADVIDDIFNGSDGWAKPGHYPLHGEEEGRQGMSPVNNSYDHSAGTTSRAMDPEGAWPPERQAFEADEMLRSLSWTIDPAQVDNHVGKSIEARSAELMS